MPLPQQDEDCPACCECNCDCTLLAEIISNPSFRKNVLTYIFIIICTYLMVSWYYASSYIPHIRPYRVQLGNMNPVWFTNRCLQLEAPISLSVSNFSSHMPTWRASTHALCKDMYEDFISFYSLDGEVDASELFRLIQRVDSLPYAPLNAKTVASLENRFTGERTAFIPRSYYTTFQPSKPRPYSTSPNLSQSSLHYVRGSTIYGRLSMLNSAVSITTSDLTDFIDQAVQWFHFAYHKDPTYCYPHILLDLDFSSPHPPSAHLVLTSQEYYGFMNMLTTTAIRYETLRPASSNYFVDLLKIHNMLGLAVKHGDSYAISYLTPRRDNEIWILTQNIDEKAHELTFAVLRTLFYNLNSSQLSLSIFPPPLSHVYPGIHQQLKLPTLIRLHSNARSQEPVTADSIFEMLLASRVQHDPFRLPKLITRNLVWKYKSF